jgi:cell division protein FtsN
MRSKDYRELQLSSSLLIFIFLGIIIVGIVIFLLGVSVGKKQTQLAENTQIPPDETLEQVTVSKPNSVQEDPISKEIASHQEPANKEPQPIEKKPSLPPPTPSKTKASSLLYYIQIGAYSSKSSADNLVARYKRMGYNALVLEPFSTDIRNIYRVRVGGYQTQEQAAQVKAELVKAENKKDSDFFIVFN